jgi:hypothetical protein
MKEYGCCPKFKRGDNSIILSRKGGGGMYLVSATPTKLLIEFFINADKMFGCYDTPIVPPI